MTDRGICHERREQPICRIKEVPASFDHHDWGVGVLVEATAGTGLRGTRARSGSLLSGVSLLLFSGAHMLTGRLLLVLLLPIIAGRLPPTEDFIGSMR